MRFKDRFFLLLFLFSAVSVEAKIDPEIHQLCLEARDYEGCVRSNSSSSTKSEYIGIGLKLYIDQETAKLMISSVIPGSPAESAGLSAGDSIDKIDGFKTQGIGVAKAAELIKGKEGSKIRLSIVKTDGKKRDVVIKRSRIVIDNTNPFDILPREFFERFREPGINVLPKGFSTEI